MGDDAVANKVSGAVDLDVHHFLLAQFFDGNDFVELDRFRTFADFLVRNLSVRNSDFIPNFKLGNFGPDGVF